MAERSVCEITYDPEIPCVVMIWQGYATSREFRAANEDILKVLIDNKATKLLGDISRFVLIGAEDQAWLNHNWIPRAIAAGLRTVALVQSSYYFNRVAVETVGQRIDPASLVLSYFGDIVAAREWLHSA
jgi:hypothetical protein